MRGSVKAVLLSGAVTIALAMSSVTAAAAAHGSVPAQAGSVAVAAPAAGLTAAPAASPVLLPAAKVSSKTLKKYVKKLNTRGVKAAKKKAGYGGTRGNAAGGAYKTSKSVNWFAAVSSGRGYTLRLIPGPWSSEKPAANAYLKAVTKQLKKDKFKLVGTTKGASFGVYKVYTNKKYVCATSYVLEHRYVSVSCALASKVKAAVKKVLPFVKVYKKSQKTKGQVFGIAGSVRNSADPAYKSYKKAKISIGTSVFVGSLVGYFAKAPGKSWVFTTGPGGSIASCDALEKTSVLSRAFARESCARTGYSVTSKVQPW